MECFFFNKSKVLDFIWLAWFSADDWAGLRRTHRNSREARRLRAGGLHVPRNTIGRTWAVHVDRTGRVGWGKSPPRVGCCCRRCRVRRRWGTKPLRRRCSCRLVVVHHCKGNGEVPLVGWWRCVCSSGCGSSCGHWLVRLPSRRRRSPFRDNETTSTQKRTVTQSNHHTRPNNERKHYVQ